MRRDAPVVRLPPLVRQGPPLCTDRPHRTLFLVRQDRSIRITTGIRTLTLSYRSRAIMSLTGGRKASGVCFPLATWNAGGIGVNQPAIIASGAKFPDNH